MAYQQHIFETENGSEFVISAILSKDELQFLTDAILEYAKITKTYLIEETSNLNQLINRMEEVL